MVTILKSSYKVNCFIIRCNFDVFTVLMSQVQIHITVTAIRGSEETMASTYIYSEYVNNKTFYSRNDKFFFILETRQVYQKCVFFICLLFIVRYVNIR
jgi:hypothetical protein